ncbi:hypothetical protein QYE76_036735 [Lolium multiflorum]|uniref:Reverse transcriptase domain-containing protein n=1 Tax=Lolium multiflorum TaxID=4521 RepID=A0AAD8R3C8_LOLMU|nr:hypothetical protein QYE76_036735 [Lolium multiflorum]
MLRALSTGHCPSCVAVVAAVVLLPAGSSCCSSGRRQDLHCPHLPAVVVVVVAVEVTQIPRPGAMALGRRLVGEQSSSSSSSSSFTSSEVAHPGKAIILAFFHRFPAAKSGDRSPHRSGLVVLDRMEKSWLGSFPASMARQCWPRGPRFHSGVGSREEEDSMGKPDEAEEEEDMVAQEGFGVLMRGRCRNKLCGDKWAKVARTKRWKLKEELAQTFKERVIKKGPWEEGGDADNMWMKMATCIHNMEKYKMAKKAAKRAVSEARGQAYEDLYQWLGTKEGEKDIYRMAKIRERKTRDVDQVKCIKDGADQLLVKDKEIKHRWREYFDGLFNGETESSTIELDNSFDDTSRRFVRRIQESEVKEALRRMKGGKAMGPDCIPIEVWRGLGDIAIVWLTKLFSSNFRANKMPEEWRRSILVPIFKNKGDVQSCTNYRGIKLMSHTMKIWERVIEHRLKRMTSVTKNQFGFMPRRSTMETIFLVRQLMERYKKQKKDLHMVFIDLEKAYDKIPRQVMWWALEKHKVPAKYITLIKDMYDNVVTSVRTRDGDTDDFPIKIGLHQGQL